MMTPFQSRLLLALALIPLAGCSGSEEAAERADVFVVKRGPLSIRVTEQAEIKPYSSTRIKNEMEGRSTIIYLIPEGTVVEEGQKLVELDASALEERKAQQGITLHRADAARLAARGELDIKKKEFEVEKLGGENTVRIAEIDLQKFLGKVQPDGSRDMGEKEQALVEAQANIQLAEQELKLAGNKLVWSVKLHEKGYITKDDLERDQLDLQRREKNLRVERNKLDILIRFTHPKERIRLDQGITEANTGLEGILARGNARLTQAQTDYEAKEKEYELARERFDNLEQQIRNAVIRAPTPGLVVYAAEDSYRGRQDFVEEGAEVRERQTLIVLPDVTRMIAALKVHEAEVDKVRAGQRTTITVDAFSDREFTGVVHRVSPVADSGSRWSNNALKVYKTEVEIDGTNTDLKPGMSASVAIIVAELDDALYVPLQAVRTQGAVNFAWVSGPSGPVARQVERGLNDTQFVEIVSGLSEGDHVFLAPPPGAIEPEFEQPKAPRATERPAGEGAMARSTTPPARPVEAEAREDRGGRAGGASGNALMEILERKYPELAKIVSSDRSAWFTNADLRQALEDDPELRQARDAMMQQWQGAGGGSSERGQRRRSGESGGSSERGTRRRPGGAAGGEEERNARGN